MAASAQKVPTPVVEPTPERWLTVEDCAIYMRNSVTKVRAPLHDGRLRAGRIGQGGYLIDKNEVDRFIERKLRILPPYRVGTRPKTREVKPWTFRKDRQKPNGRKKVRSEE
jgi:excisionase family DNA binding protein